MAAEGITLGGAALKAYQYGRNLLKKKIKKTEMFYNLNYSVFRDSVAKVAFQTGYEIPNLTRDMSRAILWEVPDELRSLEDDVQYYRESMYQEFFLKSFDYVLPIRTPEWFMKLMDKTNPTIEAYLFDFYKRTYQEGRKARAIIIDNEWSTGWRPTGYE